MDEKQIKNAAFSLVVALILIGIFISILIPASKVYREQTELLQTGTTTEATIEQVNHNNIWAATSVYAKLEYTVDGTNYTTEVPISLPVVNSFPTGRVQDGKTFVTVYYNEDDPTQVGLEGAAQSAKTAKTVSIVVICVSGLLALIFLFGPIIMIATS